MSVKPSGNYQQQMGPGQDFGLHVCLAFNVQFPKRSLLQMQQQVSECQQHYWIFCTTGNGSIASLLCLIRQPVTPCLPGVEEYLQHGSGWQRYIHCQALLIVVWVSLNFYRAEKTEQEPCVTGEGGAKAGYSAVCTRQLPWVRNRSQRVQVLDEAPGRKKWALMCWCPEEPLCLHVAKS